MSPPNWRMKGRKIYGGGQVSGVCVRVCVCVCVCARARALREAFTCDQVTPFPREGISSQSWHLGGAPATCLALGLVMGTPRGEVRVILGGKARLTALA